MPRQESPSETCCRCSRGTCPPLTPTCPRWRPPSDSVPPLPSRPASRGSSSGIAIITACEAQQAAPATHKRHAVPLEIEEGKAAVPGAAGGAHVSFPPSCDPAPPVPDLLRRGLRLGGCPSVDASNGRRRRACLALRPARIPHPGRQVIVVPRGRCVFACRTFLCRNDHLRNFLQVRHGPRARRQRILQELSLRQLIG